MKEKVLNLLRFLWRKYLYWKRGRYIVNMFKQDAVRYCEYIGDRHIERREASLARIIMGYHMIEKGLTMPKRRLGFGIAALNELMTNIESFEKQFGNTEQQLQIAIGVIRQYYDTHIEANYVFDNSDFSVRLNAFVSMRKAIPAVKQYHFSSNEFYSNNEREFPKFAQSRHTVRHFAGTINEEDIAASVKLAMTAPSACNRQHVRVHCIVDHLVQEKILSLQGGNRGFGTNADKLLLISTDLEDLRWAEERNDAFTNAGIFLMNLCYALHYHKIAHCILNWSVSHDVDEKLRTIADIPNNELIVCILACGKTPEEFEVARSTRKQLEDVLRFHR